MPSRAGLRASGPRSHPFFRCRPANASNLLTVIEPAVAPTEPISPNRVQNTALAAILGLLLVAGVIALLEFLYDGVRDTDARDGRCGPEHAGRDLADEGQPQHQ